VVEVEIDIIFVDSDGMGMLENASPHDLIVILQIDGSTTSYGNLPTVA
jgi:hypothetical protein